MDPNRPHKTKTPRPPVTVRNIISNPPGLSQSGIGIIANDSLRRQSGEVTTSSTPTYTGMNHILGFTPSSRNTVPVPRMSIPSFNPDVMSSSGYQMATPPVHSPIMSDPSVYGIPTDVTIRRYYVKEGGGACGGNGDTSGDASVSLETPMNLSNHAFSLNNQNREMNSDIGEFNESYNTAMNANELEPLQGIPPEDGHYGQNPEQQQVSWIYSPHQPNLQHLEMMGSNSFYTSPPPPADVLRPDSEQQPPPHYLQHGHALPASNYNPQSYQSPGYTWNNEPRQYSIEDQANLQRLNQGSQQQYDRVQEEYSLRQHSRISNNDVNTQYLLNTPAALPLGSQLLSSDNARSHFQELQFASPEQPTRSVIMHTNKLVSSHPDEKLTEPPVIPAAEVKRQPTIKRKRSAPKKPKIPVPQSIRSEFVEVMDLVCTRAKVKDPNPYPYGRDPVNKNLQSETEVTNELSGGETSDALTNRANLFTQLPLGPVDQGGDLPILPVCPIVTPVSSDAVVNGQVPLPENRAPTVFPPKQRKPKDKPTTQRKARRTNTKPNDNDTAQTQPIPAKGRRTKKVPKKELDQAQMEGPMFKHAVGAVLGKDAAKSCEEEQEKATNSSEKASSDVVSLMELASKLPDTTVPLKRLTDAEVFALLNSSRNATGTTPVKLLKTEEDCNATSISTVEQPVESKGELKTEENESEYETDGGTIRLKKRVRKSTTNVSGSTSRNRTRRRVSLDVTSGSDSGGDDDDYTPRTTRSKSAKGKSVSSSSGLSATGIDSDSRSSAGKRRKSRDSHFEETLGVDTASATIKQEVEEDEDDSVMEAERQTFEELIKQEAEMNNCTSKAATGSSNRKPIKMPMSGLRRHGKLNQFRKLKKSVGRPRLKENSIKMEEESSDDVQVVPSQDCFLDDSTSSSPRKRGRGKNKKVFDFSGTTGENVDNDYGVEGEGESNKFFHYRRPTYSEEETKALYGNMKFVLDVRDIDKDPSNICIWQILEAKSCLRRYFPCKFGQQQFYHSSPQHWYFAEEEFRNEEFYDRFQPVAINEANTQKHFAEGWIMEETIIQYPYVDKSFFNRMVKNVGKLERTDRLRGMLTKAIPLFIMQILQPSYLSDLQRVKQEGLIMLGPKLEEQMKSWDILENVVCELLSAFCSSSRCDFNQETLYLLQTFPKMRYSNKSVNKEVHCSACSPKSTRTPMVKVVFNTKLGCGTPYDIHTLVEHPNPLKPENDTEYWCRNCSMTAKKFHRLAHFRYSLYRIMRQNLAKDVAMFKEYDVPITDQCLLMINDVDVNWRYTVFLDLQLSMAEVEAECDPPSSTT